MGLQAIVLQAVQTAAKAIGDLAVESVLTKRIPTVYTPGGATVYTVTTHTVKTVVTMYDQKEIADDRDLASHSKLIVFHDETAIPELNDTITVRNRQYRVMRGVPTFAGSEIAFSTVQARPLSA